MLPISNHEILVDPVVNFALNVVKKLVICPFKIGVSAINVESVNKITNAYSIAPAALSSFK